MIKSIFIFLTISSFLLVSQPEQSIKTYDFEQFKSEVLESPDENSLMVINFWATWCGPCVRELPHFEKMNSDFKDKDVRIILVSLDFQDQYEKKLIPFVEEKKIESEVIWLNDTKYNDWIDQVSPEWSGAIPATVFIKNGNVLKFMEKELELEELEETINTLL